ncbi:Hypothetical predicted protein [Mytilus galloprovincialis]|uniref:COR domain-containing protein n=1 Tax=Mytilus galloprovincialis TaxID=29158 RepID=A0A8B6GEV2_MYTGA|nr:Hypothetical predicted protein [Mytilus galloprovincialis]
METEEKLNGTGIISPAASAARITTRSEWYSCILCKKKIYKRDAKLHKDFSLEDITVSRSLLKEDKSRKRVKLDDTTPTNQDLPLVAAQTISLLESRENKRHESSDTLASDTTPAGSEHIEITANTSYLHEDLTIKCVKLKAGASKSKDLLAMAQNKSLPTSEENLRQESNETLTSGTTQGSQLENVTTLSEHQFTTLPVDVGSIAEPMRKQLSDDGSEKKTKTQYNDGEYETGIQDKLPKLEKQLGSLIMDRKSSVRSRNRDELVQQGVLFGNENTDSLNNRVSRENFPDNAKQIDDTDGSPAKSCFSDEMHIETVTKPGVIRKLKNIFGVSKNVKEIQVSMTKEQFLKMSSKVGKKQLHNKMIAPIIIWDFGGQDVFYSTHQTFLTYRAIYMIVLDGSRKLDDPCPYEQYLPGKNQHKTSRERQPTWGEHLPKCFIPLELEFALLTKRNIPLITLEHLKKINSSQPIRPLSEDELKVFLKFQHSIGKLLYFEEHKLDDRIVLSPTLLIDAFKSIVTDRRFCKGDRNREEIWDAMGMKGVVLKQAIHEVWKRKKYAKFNKDKDYLLAVMTHLDILVEPKRYDSSRTRIPADFYYVASMVRAIDDSGYLQSPGITKRNIALAFQSSSLMIPPALSFRFISYCLSVWAVKTYGENNRDMLFHRSGVLTIDPSLDMYIL